MLELPGGVLEATWPGEGHEIHLSGPAVRVFDGRWPL
jgi:diaminopimelate epimerase